MSHPLDLKPRLVSQLPRECSAPPRAGGQSAHSPQVKDSTTRGTMTSTLTNINTNIKLYTNINTNTNIKTNTKTSTTTNTNNNNITTNTNSTTTTNTTTSNTQKKYSLTNMQLGKLQVL